jgi:hypothetical protein
MEADSALARDQRRATIKTDAMTQESTWDVSDVHDVPVSLAVCNGFLQERSFELGLAPCKRGSARKWRSGQRELECRGVLEGAEGVSRVSPGECAENVEEGLARPIGTQ